MDVHIISLNGSYSSGIYPRWSGWIQSRHHTHGMTQVANLTLWDRPILLTHRNVHLHPQLFAMIPESWPDPIPTESIPFFTHPIQWMSFTEFYFIQANPVLHSLIRSIGHNSLGSGILNVRMPIWLTNKNVHAYLIIVPPKSRTLSNPSTTIKTSN